MADAALGIVAAVKACTADGVCSGEFRPGLDPDRAARFLFATFEGGVMLAGLIQDPAGFAEIKEDMMAVTNGWAVQPAEAGA